MGGSAGLEPQGHLCGELCPLRCKERLLSCDGRARATDQERAKEQATVVRYDRKAGQRRSAGAVTCPELELGWAHEHASA